jgi:DNA helicase-2/ATP-dependent DNA helicase PcrA
MNSIFDNLNDKQKEAVLATEGKVRVIAGAGSGKTRVLAHRFAYLVNEIGISPSNILCMTFTNKAAQEMRNRIAKMVHTGHVNDFVCTIHGFCVKVLRRDIHRMGYPKNFIIHDDEDAKSFAKQVMEEFGMDYTITTLNKFLNDVQLAKAFSRHLYIEKNVLPTAEKLNKEDIEPIDRYIQLQVNNFAIDFQDIIYFALHLLETYKDVRSYWQDKLNYIMVDEVQDCSRTDWELINIISEKYNNLFIVGDPDQAIYEWRGALPKYFVNYEADKDVILAENYRSTPNILDVANSIIANNEERVKKDLFTRKPLSKKTVYFHGKSEEEEAMWIANRICELNKTGVEYNDIAILYRASYLSRNIEQALIRKQVKYTVWGGIRFFERMEIKDSLAYLRLVANRDDLSFQRIVNVPSRKFGEKSMKLLKEYSEHDGTNLYQTLINHKEDKMFNKESLLAFIELIEECTTRQSNITISELFDYLLKNSGLWDMYRKEGDEDRIENINELINSIRLYESIEREENATLETYLQDVALFTNADYKDDGETVKLMTIHQAKGLEFPFVFVCGLNEGIFPSLRTIRNSGKRGLEEERRLMYVAVTRAERALFLTESEGYSFTLKSAKFPSRFLVEIKDDLLKVKGDFNASLFKATKEFVKNGIDWQEFDLPRFSVGDHVMHRVFGEGVIEACESDDEGLAFRVRFTNGIRFIRGGHLYQKSSVQKPVEEKKERGDQERQSPKSDESVRDSYDCVRIGDFVIDRTFGKGIIDACEEGMYGKVYRVQFDHAISYLRSRLSFRSITKIIPAEEIQETEFFSQCKSTDTLNIPNLNIGDHVIDSHLGEGVIEACEQRKYGKVYRTKFASAIAYLNKLSFRSITNIIPAETFQ